LVRGLQPLPQPGLRRFLCPVGFARS